MKRLPDIAARLSHEWFFAGTLALALILAGADARGEEAAEKKLGWFFKASAGWVWVGGNSESNSFAAGAEARRVWTNSELLLTAGGTQTETTIKTRWAEGTKEDYFVNEVESSEKTTELYFARARYDYNFSRRFFAFGGVDWLRNRFAGIDSRELVALGAGNTWADGDDLRFKTDYGVTYTFEKEVVENPFGMKSDFPGARLGYDFWWKFTDTAEFGSLFVADWNLDNTDDIRIESKNELPVSVSDRLKLKPALQFFWRNYPAFTTVGFVNTDDTVNVQLEKLDTIFTLSLVFEM